MVSNIITMILFLTEHTFTLHSPRLINQCVVEICQVWMGVMGAGRLVSVYLRDKNFGQLINLHLHTKYLLLWWIFLANNSKYANKSKAKL